MNEIIVFFLTFLLPLKTQQLTSTPTKISFFNYFIFNLYNRLFIKIKYFYFFIIKYSFYINSNLIYVTNLKKITDNDFHFIFIKTDLKFNFYFSFVDLRMEKLKMTFFFLSSK